jgi:endonuclease/exonuclease/phosphatase (EEP) superfamily protein YafD
MEAVGGLVRELTGKERFILGGDLNVTDESPVYGRLVEAGLEDDRPESVRNTLHPELHKLKGAKELAVDYVFHKGRGIGRRRGEVPVVPVSDHLPMVVEYEVGN